MHASQQILKALAENPPEAIMIFKEYEKIIVNFYQVIYWMRPLQALQGIKDRLLQQIQDKDNLRVQIGNMLKELKNDLNEIIE